jgi:hypothetical protein
MVTESPALAESILILLMKLTVLAESMLIVEAGASAAFPRPGAAAGT